MSDTSLYIFLYVVYGVSHLQLIVIHHLFTDVTHSYSAKYVKEYIERAKPIFSVGEYWDSCNYNGTYLEYNQGISLGKNIHLMFINGLCKENLFILHLTFLF